MPFPRASKALSRFTVLDLTRVRAGPTCARQLADWGANVIKIEAPPDSDEPMGGPRERSDFQNLHRNKRSITLNLKAPQGLAAFKRLVKKADVLIENFRPAVKKRLGIDYKTLSKINPAWGERATWAAIKGASGPMTSFYLLATLDLTRNVDGAIVAAPPDQAIYRDVFARTFTISFGVTALCLILGFPVAYLLATLPPRRSNLLMIFVLLPFWTSLLVRTCAWIVLLQREGVVNNSLRWLGIVDEPLRLIYNRFGVYVAMTHVLLPFMILPLYSSMKAISPAYMRAAASLGASPVTAFLRVYLPQTLPGIGAGCLLVFILALGYYITPALVGGAADQMISYFIALYTTETVNWGLASALGAVLLLATLLLAAVYGKLVHGQQVTGGMKN